MEICTYNKRAKRIIGFKLSDSSCLGKFGQNIKNIELELVKYNTPCASGEFLVLSRLILSVDKVAF